MSGFLSRKYLQYRNIASGTNEPQAIDSDSPCASCGYNLRGLKYGGRCPECGELIGRDPARVLVDPLLSGDPSRRWRVCIGLGVSAACLLVALFARFALFLDNVFWIVGLGIRYVVASGVIAIVWIGACFMMMAAAPTDSPRMRKWAQIALWSQLLWIPGYILFGMRVHATVTFAPTERILEVADLLVRGVAGAGALGIAFFMMRAAEDAELDDAPRRLNNAIWILPIFTVVLALMPRTMGWVSAITVFLLLLAWCWFMLEFSRGLWEMHKHVAWAIRLRSKQVGQLRRIDERKREIEDELESRIRPVSRSGDEVHLGEGRGAAIRHSEGSVRKSRPKNEGDHQVEFMG